MLVLCFLTAPHTSNLMVKCTKIAGTVPNYIVGGSNPYGQTWVAKETINKAMDVRTQWCTHVLL